MQRLESNRSIKSSLLIHRAISENYTKLCLLLHQCTQIHSESRRKHLLRFLTNAKLRFLQLFVLLQHSIQCPLLARCHQMRSRAQMSRQIAASCANRMLRIRNRLLRLYTKRFNMSAVMNDLYGNRSIRWKNRSFCMETQRIPPFLRMERMRTRLLETFIPKNMSICIRKSCVYCDVNGIFRLTIQFDVSRLEWRVKRLLSFVFDAFHYKNKVKHKRNMSQTPFVIDRSKWNAYLFPLIQIILNAAEHPFLSLLHLMRDFHASIAVHLLLLQESKLIAWRNRVSMEITHENVLDIYLWTFVLSKQKCKRVRICLEQTVLSMEFLPPLPVSLPNRIELLDKLPIHMCMEENALERIVLHAMRAHAAAMLYEVRNLLIVFPYHENGSTQLLSGARVRMNYSHTLLAIRSDDIGGLCHSLQISFDMFTCSFVTAVSRNECIAALDQDLRDLEAILNVFAGLRDAENEYKRYENPSAMAHEAVSKIVREIARLEIAELGSCMQGIEICSRVNLHWDRYIQFRQQHGHSTEIISVSKDALFFQLSHSKQSMYYILVEVDRYADVETEDDCVSFDEYVRFPSFTLLQTIPTATNTLNRSVQFFQRIPAPRKENVFSFCARLSASSFKRKRCFHAAPPTRTQTKTQIQALLLHVLRICTERIQLQHCMNFARRRKSRIRYSGEGACPLSCGTGSQIISFSFPENLNTFPLLIRSVQAHFLDNQSGFQICLQLQSPPFRYVFPSNASANRIAFCRKEKEQSHCINDNGDLILFFPLSTQQSENAQENPLEIFLLELMYVIKPMCELGVQLELQLSPIHRYMRKNRASHQFYVESANPMEIVLLCQCPSFRNACSQIEYRLSIQYKRKIGFMFQYSHRHEHMLLPFIQSAFNGHTNVLELLEAMERTAIPLGMLTYVMESQLSSVKYSHTHSLHNETQLLETCFLPEELSLIPRSQTHIRLCYRDRYALDLHFLQVLSIHNVSRKR